MDPVRRTLNLLGEHSALALAVVYPLASWKVSLGFGVALVLIGTAQLVLGRPSK